MEALDSTPILIFDDSIEDVKAKILKQDFEFGNCMFLWR